MGCPKTHFFYTLAIFWSAKKWCKDTFFPPSTLMLLWFCFPLILTALWPQVKVYGHWCFLLCGISVGSVCVGILGCVCFLYANALLEVSFISKWMRVNQMGTRQLKSTAYLFCWFCCCSTSSYSRKKFEGFAFKGPYFFYICFCFVFNL